MVGGAFRTPAVAVSGTPAPSRASRRHFAPAAPQWGRSAATFRGDRNGANSAIGVGQEISDCYSEESYPTTLRYEARASISLGDNLLAIRGIGSAAPSNPSLHCSSLLFK
jgi:hypothetical protein